MIVFEDRPRARSTQSWSTLAGHRLSGGYRSGAEALLTPWKIGEVCSPRSSGASSERLHVRKEFHGTEPRPA